MMTEAAMYIVTIMKYAINATLKDTNLNTFIIAIISIMAIISVYIQFLSAAHHPPTRKHPKPNPIRSITLTLSLKTVLSTVIHPVLMK
jgi:disulfide bond formation protein DsbB